MSAEKLDKVLYACRVTIDKRATLEFRPLERHGVPDATSVYVCTFDGVLRKEHLAAHGDSPMVALGNLSSLLLERARNAAAAADKEVARAHLAVDMLKRTLE